MIWAPLALVALGAAGIVPASRDKTPFGSVGADDAQAIFKNCLDFDCLAPIKLPCIANEAQALTRFVLVSEHFRQFSQAQSAVQNLEKNTRRLAQEADQDGGREAQNHVQGDDGNQWCMGPELEEKVNLTHRSTAEGMEFAVIERLDMKSGTSYNVSAQGNDAATVLRAFTRDESRVLHLWSDDVAVQATERLAEKYPGQDLSRLAESITNRLTNARLDRQTIRQAETQKRSRRIDI